MLTSPRSLGPMAPASQVPWTLFLSYSGSSPPTFSIDAFFKELVYRGRVLRKSTINGEPETNGVNGHQEDVDSSQMNGTQGERNDPKSAWVMAVYEDDAGDEQKWKRTITNQGASEYRLNERVVTAQQYNESLEQENILIKSTKLSRFPGRR